MQAAADAGRYALSLERRFALDAMQRIEEMIIALGILALWQGTALCFSLSRGSKAETSRRGLALFLICGSLLALFRSWAYWYLSYRLRTHSIFDGTLRPLELSVLPEVGFVGLVQIENVYLWLGLMYGALIVGSFLWALPLLLFSTRKKLP